MNTHKFSHESLLPDATKELVYTAMSKHYFYFRMHISKYVLEQEKVPLNPFMIFDYFLLDSIDRDFVRSANNSIVQRADQIWVFGPVSNGVLAEIMLAKKAHKPILYFAIKKPCKIISILKDEVEMEDDVEQFRSVI